jgi:hypothetical protein
MNSRPRLRLILTNIKYDIENNRLNTAHLESLVRALVGALRNLQRPSAPDVLLKDCADAADPPLYCRSRHASDRMPCSRIIDDVSFFIHNVDWAATGQNFPASIPEGDIRDLARNGLAGVAIGYMQTSRPFAWVTPQADVAKARQDPSSDDFPNRLRDKLGLRCLADDSFLIEIRYPDSVWQTSLFCSPTFIEGCPELAYLSKVRSDGWGESIDLATGDPGMREAVHPRIPFDESFELCAIGRLTRTPSSFDFTKLMIRYQRSWQLPDQRLLEELL